MWHNTGNCHLTWTLWFTLRLCIYYCLKWGSAHPYLFHSFDHKNCNNFFIAQYPQNKIMSSWCCTISPTNYRKKQSSESIQWTSTRHTHIHTAKLKYLKTQNRKLIQLAFVLNQQYRPRIHARWHSQLGWLWARGPGQVVCEVISLLCFHTMPGQHSQPTPVSLGKVCM